MPDAALRSDTPRLRGRTAAFVAGFAVVERSSLAFDDVLVSEYVTFLEQMRSADLAMLLQ